VRGLFPRPFVITVGMVKGGSCKTWWAFNLASALGLAGYRVVAVDLNPQHDLAADYQILLKRGIWPRFNVLKHDTLESAWNAKLDLRAYDDFDFIVYDTPQFLNFEVIRFAWTNCHLMLAPFTPEGADLKNCTAAVRQYHALPGERGPIICMPCRVSKLKNNLAFDVLKDCLALVRELGCEVPNFSQSFLIDHNPSLALQETRWVYDTRIRRGVERTVTQKFLDTVDLNITWILRVMQKHYGALPPAPLSVIPPDDPEKVRALLAAELSSSSEQKAVWVS
jgi:hypothetical protein